jgi:single-strand DNA-binding protein
MSNLNKAMLIGRLGQDPETRYTKSGSAVTSFSLATNDFWKDKQGNRQEKTDWHNIVAWGQLADFSQNYLRKGRLVYVEGRLQTRDWVDQQNVKHYKTEIVANTIQLLDRQPDAQGGEGRPAGGRSGYSDYSPAGDKQQGGEAREPSASQEGEEPYLEDDIPF